MNGMSPFGYSGLQGMPMGGPAPMGGPMPTGGPMPMGGPSPVGGPTPMGGPRPMAGTRAEQTYVENILRMNRGKVATVYTTNENNPEWAAKIFKGRVENAARDHVVLSDPETGTRYIVLMVNIDFITFDEPLRYEPAFYGQ